MSPSAWQRVAFKKMQMGLNFSALAALARNSGPPLDHSCWKAALFVLDRTGSINSFKTSSYPPCCKQVTLEGKVTIRELQWLRYEI